MNDLEGVSVAEKRTELESKGEPWPVGSDGLEKMWHRDVAEKAGGSWRLRSTIREGQATRRAKRRADGICRECPRPVEGSDSEFLCSEHLDNKRTYQSMWQNTTWKGMTRYARGVGAKAIRERMGS